MNMHAWQTMNIFNPSIVLTPPIVHIFTLMRHGDYIINDMGYPETGCETQLSDAKMAGDAASKLTAALSIHMDGFIGLACYEAELSSRNVSYVARFNKDMTGEEVKAELEMKAADIIDTLMALA
jgi:L-fucose mutarotase/ribose pyranase (RbsD/FucU family)